MNVLPSEATMEGTIRVFDYVTLDQIKEKMTQIASSIAPAFGCKAELTFSGFYPPVINAYPDATQAIRRTSEKVFGADSISTAFLPVPGSEDFS